VVRIGPEFADVRVEGLCIAAQAGARLQDLCNLAAESSLSGLEFAVGIPGTLGGGLVMNAGAYEGCLADVVIEVRAATPEGTCRAVPPAECGFGYRTSAFRQVGLVLTGGTLQLADGDSREIRARHEGIRARRRAAQPLNLPSAGSVFQRPPGDYAGRLIEAAGLKGVRAGGAAISEKHANFIVNEGDATALDVLALVDLVRTRVHETQGVCLEPELVVIGEDPT
jgi:UDP-N-acetylmuramate dehydrogenase